MSARITQFLAENDEIETPFLVVDLDIVEQNFKLLAERMPAADIYYAMKANPAPEILERLVALGSHFDTASIGEIEDVIAAGANPENLSFGNTIKKQRDIAKAYNLGVRLFAFDSELELQKLAESAPGSKVFCRILVDCAGADWPLSRKFGCSPDMAEYLLVEAKKRGLEPYGVSFHVGSQQGLLKAWDEAVAETKAVFTRLAKQGIELEMVNLGGGLPTPYRDDINPIQDYADAIMMAMTTHFGNDLPRMILEPGRYMAGNAGVLQSEVVLISRKSFDTAEKRWVYLDVGKFHGLIETLDEAIRYPVETDKDFAAKDLGPVILAGPTCDSVDIMYEETAYELPMNLAVGDKVRFLSTGAYTTTYSSVGFNGLPPLKAYYI